MDSVDICALLSQALPTPRRELLNQIIRLAEARHQPLYLAGGVVRDLLLGITPGDFDLVVEGNAPALARAAARCYGGKVVLHTSFATAAWYTTDGAIVDFATARTEIYLRPATLPRVMPATIDADLHRRDFTINALAVRLDGESRGGLYDPHDGQADLNARLIRVLHPRSFRDDPTRIFRAVRYEQRLGFSIAADTLALLPNAWKALDALSGDRLRREFELIFREPRAAAILERLAELDILRHVHPTLSWNEPQSARAALLNSLPLAEWRVTIPPPPAAFYLALLMAHCSLSECRAALRRLNVNRELAAAVPTAVGLTLTGHRPSEMAAQMESKSEPALMIAYVLKEEARPVIHAYLADWRFVRPQTTGAHLIKLGLTPGPHFKRILGQLRAARLDGEITSGAAERKRLRELIQEEKNSSRQRRTERHQGAPKLPRRKQQNRRKPAVGGR